MKRNYFKPAIMAAVASVLVFSAARCSSPKGYVALQGHAQGGTYTVKFNADGASLSIEEIRNAVDSILTLVDTTLSGYNKSSILSRFNAGEQVTPTPIFEDILSMSRKYFNETGGALDVASGPLYDAWGFGFKNGTMPSSTQVDSLLAFCGMANLGENLESLIPGKTPTLNFNAVAQGYTSDLIASFLHSAGISDMLVDIGEIYCEGVNQKGQPWKVGIDLPRDGNMTLGADLDGIWQGDGSGCGIVTSGNYRKYYVKDGKKYSHTIDPRTGYPVGHSLLSATIVAPSAADADAYATCCMVLGLDEARKFILSHDSLEGYLIYDQDGQMMEWASPGFNLVGQ